MCVIAGDALGEVGATQLIRINYSARDIAKLELFRAALPLAIRDAQSGRYLPGVQAFYNANPAPKRNAFSPSWSACTPGR